MNNVFNVTTPSKQMVIKICVRCGDKWEDFDALSYIHLCPRCRGKKKYWHFKRDNKTT